MPQLSLFISCVSNEFGHYRDALRQDLSRPNLTTKIQEDFTTYGTATLQKLDEYIQSCEAIIHICGDMTGSMANAVSLEYINKAYPNFSNRFPELQLVMEGEEEMSYTQWEAWLAAYHSKYLFIAAPTAAAVRNATYALVPEQQAHQQQHLSRLRNRGYYNEIQFGTEEGLALQLYRSRLGDLLNKLYPNKPINLPYHTIGSLFKGRDADLIKLYQSLKNDAPRPAAIIGNTIYGLGGIGKTRLAVEYAWSYRNEYAALLLVRADTPENLITNLAALAAPIILNLPEHAAKEEPVRYAAVINWLNQHPGWLLIMDNADTPEAAAQVEAIYEKLSDGYVLITSRQKDWSPQVSRLQLDVLEPDASVSFLLERTNDSRRKTADDDNLAGQIAHDLGYLALALEQAGAYISTQEITLLQYRQDWQDNHDAVLEWYDARLMKYPGSVAITWQTSVNQLSANAATLLNRLAWLAPDSIPESLLKTKAAEDDTINGWTGLVELAKYSLVKKLDTPEFTIHRLVQDVARRKQEKGGTEHCLEQSLNWVNNAFVGDPYDVRNWQVLEPLIAHSLFLTEESSKKEIGNLSTVRLLSDTAAVFKTKAKYQQAESFMRKTLQLSQKSLGEKHSMVATHKSNLAVLLQITNRLAEAEKLMWEVLQIDKENFGNNHPKIAIRLNNLASLLRETNRLTDAEPMMREALQIDEKNFGKRHPSVARDLNNLADILRITDRLTEAESLIRRALQIDKENFGDNHPDVARDLGTLALLLKDSKRFKEAEPLIRRALVIDERHFDKDHPVIAVRLNNLAQLLYATNRLVEVEPMIRRALQIDEKNFGENNRIVSNHLNSLAQLLRTTNRFAEAELLLRRAVQIDKKIFGENHPQIVKNLNSLALLLQSINRLAEAELLMRKAFIIFSTKMGLNHHDTLTVSKNYALLLQVMGKSDKEINCVFSSLLK